MFKKIIGTGGTRLLNAFCGFVTLWLATRYLGPKEWGIGSIVLVDVTMMLIAVELFAGSGLIFFTPRKKLSTLMIVSFSWIMIINVFFGLCFWVLSYFPGFFHHIVPEGYASITILLTFVYSFHNFNLNYFIGKERIGTFNLLYILQFMTQLVTILLMIFVFKVYTAHAFVYSLLCGYLVGMLVGFCLLIPYIKKEGFDPIRETTKAMFNYGSVIQLSTLVHMLNKRLSYYFLDLSMSIGAVGIYSSGTQISEGVKLIGHSISLVQFSSISNSNDKEYAGRLSLQLLKISVILTALAFVVIALIPVSVFEFVFTKEFAQIKEIILLLSPGVVMLAANTVFSHYFSGTDVPKYNLYASLIGFAITIPSVLILVPSFGIIGACISATLTYIITVVYQWIIFRKYTGYKVKDLLLSKEDWSFFVKECQKIFKKSC